MCRRTKEKGRDLMGCRTEVFSRVVGFFRPVQAWNPGKGVKGEFADRVTFKKENFNDTHTNRSREDSDSRVHQDA